MEKKTETKKKVREPGPDYALSNFSAEAQRVMNEATGQRPPKPRLPAVPAAAASDDS